MGCICTKEIPPEEVARIRREKSPAKASRQFAVSSRREDVVKMDRVASARIDGVAARVISMPRVNDVAPPTVSENVVDRKYPHHVINSSTQKQESLQLKQVAVDISAKKAELNLKNAYVPNGSEAEYVAAGWPSWLASNAGEAIKGLVPRKADTFEKLNKIGQGTYSNVYRGRDLESGKIVALKKVRFVNMDPESVRFMAREISILRRLDHPNIVKLEGIITSRNSSSLYLVFEYMEHDLSGLAAIPGIKFSEPEVKCFMEQLLRGLQYCHSRGVLHRDIKGANLLLDNNGILKIADFGLATTFDHNKKQPLTSRVVTLWYRPPELLLGATEYDVAVDLWSSGCILAELLAGKPIMPGRTEVEQMHKIFKLCGSPSEDYWRKSKLPHATIFKPQRPYRRCLLETFKEFPPSALDLLDILLSIEPENRGTAISALNSEFLNSKPYPCDPSTLPRYPPSKEFDAKLRDEETRRQREAKKGQRSQSVRRDSKESNAVIAQYPNMENKVSLQRKQPTFNPCSRAEKYNPKETNASRLHDGLPVGTSQNGFSHSASFMHPTAFESSGNAIGRTSSARTELNGLDLKTRKSYVAQVGGGDLPNIPGLGTARSSMKYENQVEISKHTQWPDNLAKFTQLDVAEASEKKDWRPSSTPGKDERQSTKEPNMGARKNRIHYSGPLMPPGGNMEDMLKEHERQIQQAVRKARLSKSKMKMNSGDKTQFEASLRYPGRNFSPDI